MRAPIRPLSGRWPGPIEERAARFFWIDPRVILDEDVSAEDFRRAMAAIDAGQTMKITGTKRHGGGDAMLIEYVDVKAAHVVDIGASDGSTSLELIEQLPGFASYVIADLFLSISARRVGKRTLFFDANGRCILIVGSRTVAWPARSKAVDLLATPLV